MTGADSVIGVMTSLLQEIISVYTLLNPSQLTAAASNRVCNALALLQCVASHNETRALFLNGMRPFLGSCYLLIMSSTYSTLPLPIPQHHLQIQTLRVPAPHIIGSHWCTCQERLLRCDQLPPHHRNHPSLSAHHGDWIRIEQDCCHLHRPEDSAGRPWTQLHLCYIREVLCCGHSLEQYGHTTRGTADC